MDGHFSVVVDGVQHSFHASRRAPRDRAETSVGPLSVQVLEPLRRVRVRIAPNETGIECDLVFTARSVAAEEPRSVLHDDGRLIMHTSRFTQFGCWEGYFSVNGQRQEVRAARTAGARDKSWGVRPVGEPEGGAPGLLNGEPGVYWFWAPIDFGDVCTQFNTFQGRNGETQQLGACLMPAYDDPASIPAVDAGLKEIHEARHSVRWKSGTRRAAGAEIELVEPGGAVHTITLEPVLDFLMKGIGYSHPEWGHGVWKGELQIGAESWRVAEQHPLDPAHIHAHQLVRARMGDRTGVARIADPYCELYRSFGLGKAGFWELFGPRVWLRGMIALFRGCGVGHLAGEGLQMPGVFLFHRGKVMASQPARSAADLPDLEVLFAAQQS
jgi:hypothetical protein